MAEIIMALESYKIAMLQGNLSQQAGVTIPGMLTPDLKRTR